MLNPDFAHSLRNADLGALKIIADLWGVELTGGDPRLVLTDLIRHLTQPDLVIEVIEALPQEAQQAIHHLHAQGGRSLWTTFARRYGPFREMGPARRDREQPFRAPVSTLEVLWYRGLIGRDFFDGPGGAQEYAYIPGDLMALLPHPSARDASPAGCPASPEEISHIVPANDRILDRTCTRLAALRLPPSEKDPVDAGSVAPVLQPLLFCAGLIDADGNILAEPTRAFLEAPRERALMMLYKAWLESPSFNELRLLPGVRCEGGWVNDPLASRRFVLDQLDTLPKDTWWSLAEFVAAIHDRHPDFQRPAGDYDSWFIRRDSDGEYLRGFDHWDEVDGALIRFIVAGMLHWLGVIDLASPGPGKPATAFKRSKWAHALLGGNLPEGFPAENANIEVSPNGNIRFPTLAPRAARYLVARFCVWDGEKGGEFRYRLTPGSLARAKEQGLKVNHLLGLLRRYSSNSVPPRLIQALERWDNNGVQASLEQIAILRVKTPEIMNAIRKSPAGRFLGVLLGPTAVEVKPGAWEKVVRAVEELGYLVEEDR